MPRRRSSRRRSSDSTLDVDVAVVGSGFGGSVTALRLAEKGYRVAVLESGRRFGPDDYPTTSWDLRRFLWFPRVGLNGIQRMALLRDVLVVSGAGVGGGSLVYANTLYRPLDAFYDDPQWADITDWHDELDPFYDQAERMLGVTEVPFETTADRLLAEVADELGVGASYHPTRVGVVFGEGPGQRVPDPFFGGAGPERSTCQQCGACMTGCRHGAKNSLDRNYLWLAERSGARVFAEHEVTDLDRLDDGRWQLTTRHPGPGGARTTTVVQARDVVLSAGALGTQRLLHRWRDEGRLPELSPTLGGRCRTNSEAIVAAEGPAGADLDLSEGVAITSSIHTDEHTHIEPVRYGKGSNLFGLLTTLMVDGGGRVPRPLRFLGQVLAHPVAFARSLSVRRWSERSVILLVMQSLDTSIRVVRRRGIFGWHLTTRAEDGTPNATWIPAANDAARRVARRIGGEPRGAINEALLDVPTTAHFIGGCVVSETAATGVIDPYHRVHGIPGLHVVDGAAVSANLGVNPSLTITAMAERAMALWPNRGEEDPRPAPGAPYRRVDPVAPRSPAVPAEAPAALRIGVRGERAAAP
jgi:cholesterol oxidase